MAAAISALKLTSTEKGKAKAKRAARSPKVDDKDNENEDKHLNKGDTAEADEDPPANEQIDSDEEINMREKARTSGSGKGRGRGRGKGKAKAAKLPKPESKVTGNELEKGQGPKTDSAGSNQLWANLLNGGSQVPTPLGQEEAASAAAVPKGQKRKGDKPDGAQEAEENKKNKPNGRKGLPVLDSFLSKQWLAFKEENLQQLRGTMKYTDVMKEIARRPDLIPSSRHSISMSRLPLRFPAPDLPTSHTQPFDPITLQPQVEGTSCPGGRGGQHDAG